MINIKVLKALALIFAVLTICGAIYMISTSGEVSPGYAVVPMIFSLAFSSMVRDIKKKNTKEGNSDK
jgi:hypothetical protein